MIKKLNPNDWDMEKTINKINEIIDHLPQEKEPCSHRKEDRSCELNDAFCEPKGEENCESYKPKQPTKEVPDIREILDRVYDAGFRAGRKNSPAGMQITIDTAIQEISALYRKEKK